MLLPLANFALLFGLIFFIGIANAVTLPWWTGAKDQRVGQLPDVNPKYYLISNLEATYTDISHDRLQITVYPANRDGKIDAVVTLDVFDADTDVLIRSPQIRPLDGEEFENDEDYYLEPPKPIYIFIEDVPQDVRQIYIEAKAPMGLFGRNTVFFRSPIIKPAEMTPLRTGISRISDSSVSSSDSIGGGDVVDNTEGRKRNILSRWAQSTKSFLRKLHRQFSRFRQFIKDNIRKLGKVKLFKLKKTESDFDGYDDASSLMEGDLERGGTENQISSERFRNDRLHVVLSEAQQFYNNAKQEHIIVAGDMEQGRDSVNTSIDSPNNFIKRLWHRITDAKTISASSKVAGYEPLHSCEPEIPRPNWGQKKDREQYESKEQLIERGRRGMKMFEEDHLVFV